MASRRPGADILGASGVMDTSIESRAAATLIEKGLLQTTPLTVQEALDLPMSGSSYVMYEAIVDGKARYYPATTATPRSGKFYGIRTFEDNERTRVLISHKDYNESFPFSEGAVLTKYGIDTGKTCNITLKLVDVMIDVGSEKVIGVYLVIMTPSFAQIDVDAVRLVRELEQQDISRIKEETLTHEALMLKFQLHEAMKQAETYRQALFDRDVNIVKLAEDFAAPIIETTISALSAAKDMFEEYYKTKSGNWLLENKKLVLGFVIFAAAAALIYLFGPWR
jgi:hypothetical protein